MNSETIHQFSAGVNILLERIKTNPEDFESVGRFTSIVEDVFDSVQDSSKGWVLHKAFRVRMLTDEEIIALHEAFMALERPKFDAWVIREMLTDKNENSKPWQDAFSRANSRASILYKAQGMQAKQIAAQQAMLQNSVKYDLTKYDAQAAVYGLNPLPPRDSLTKIKPKSFWSGFFKGMAGQ